MTKFARWKNPYWLEALLVTHGALNGLNLVEVSQCLLCILAFSLVLTQYLSNHKVLDLCSQSFHALVALKPLVSLISRLVACSAKRVVDR